MDSNYIIETKNLTKQYGSQKSVADLNIHVLSLIHIFIEILQFGLILGSILVICEVSTVFAQESQTKMLPLIFSTQEGRRKDVWAKIFASFTFTVFIFAWIVVVNLILCWMVYGLNGFNNISWIILSQYMRRPILFLKYLGILLGLAFQAFLSLCALTLCVSAYQSS